MTELEKYISTKKPIKSSERVRWEMETKAKAMADRFFPIDVDKTKYEQMYLLGMYEAIELIYN